MMQKLMQSQLRQFYANRFFFLTLTPPLKNNNLVSLRFYPKNSNWLLSSYKSRFKFNNEPPKNKSTILYALTVTGLLQFLGLSEEDEDSELMQVLKRGELCYRREEFEKSEQIYHIALKLAQELHNEDAVTFIYDRLANVAFESQQYEKARKLFIEVMNRLFHKGMKEDDIAVIHISFKLAKIFEYLKDYFGATSGYDYCFQKLEPKLKERNEEFEDARMLYKTLLNGYAYFNYSLGKLDKALEYFKKTYDVIQEIYGEENEESVLLLNNLGTISKHKGNLNEAFNYFHEAEKIGKKLPNMKNFSFVYLNLAYCYMETNLLAEAHKYCEFAKGNAATQQYEEGTKEAEDCIIKVQELKKQKM